MQKLVAPVHSGSFFSQHLSGVDSGATLGGTFLLQSFVPASASTVHRLSGSRELPSHRPNAPHPSIVTERTPLTVLLMLLTASVGLQQTISRASALQRIGSSSLHSARAHARTRPTYTGRCLLGGRHAVPDLGVQQISKRGRALLSDVTLQPDDKTRNSRICWYVGLLPRALPTGRYHRRWAKVKVVINCPQPPAAAQFPTIMSC